MFLNTLKSEQKDLFMKLAIRAAEANGVVELEEKNMLKAYGMEMEIAPIYQTDDKFDDILKRVRAISSEKELRIFTFEILGIMISDSVFDDQEKEFVKKMIKEFSISEQVYEEMLSLLTEYTEVYQKIKKAVIG